MGSGSRLRVLTFPSELCLLSEDSGRAYRHCLAQGTWQKLENSTGIWQDDSECAENHSFKENVSVLGSVRTRPGAKPPTTLHQGPPWPSGFRGHTESLTTASLPQAHPEETLSHTKQHPLWQPLNGFYHRVRGDPLKEFSPQHCPSLLFAVPSAWSSSPQLFCGFFSSFRFQFNASFKAKSSTATPSRVAFLITFHHTPPTL